MPNAHRRPVHLNLFLIRMPAPAVLSIAHRFTGVLLVLLTPVLIYVLDLSLAGPEGFARAQRLLSGELSASMWFVLAWALLHHLLAGIRYLALDLDVGVDKATERTTAWLVLVGAPLAALLLMAGVWL